VADFFGKILVVDDDVTLRKLLESKLEASGFQYDSVADLTAMRKAVRERSYDAILLDLMLGDEDGLSAIPFLVTEAPHAKVIMMSAHGTIEIAVSAMERGATAFISKGKDPENIVSELKKRLAKMPRDPGDGSGESYGIFGSSPAIRDVIARINQIKDVDTNILITGETGTGKELVARAIHLASSRHNNRFEAINCGAIPGSLLESELFGHKKGAFTDAKSDRKGIFEICSRGTLLLDEIGEMPTELQVKLLRVIQEKKVTPVGSTQSVHVDSRIVSATHQNLADAIHQGSFREDLFYRLAVITIHIPPLRDRAEDIPYLVGHFLGIYNEKFGKNVAAPSHDLEARLTGYSWPGNIRELKNAVERGVVLAVDGKLNIDDMILTLPGGNGDAAPDRNEDFVEKTLSEAKQDFERRYLQQLLEATRGNISEMARISGRYRTDIYRLLTKHGVEWEEFRP
jgi:DNA-binding NtrC family response regulator